MLFRLLCVSLLVSATPCLALTDAENRELAAGIEELKAELPIRTDKSTSIVAVTYEPSLALITYWASVELRVTPDALAQALNRTHTSGR